MKPHKNKGEKVKKRSKSRGEWAEPRGKSQRDEAQSIKRVENTINRN